MNKYEIVRRIEAFAPLETQEKWDSSGWGVETEKKEIKKILFALTVTDKIVEQALNLECDMIISHHPLFFVPLEYKNIDIYSAHTNLDRAEGGTTDCIIEELGLKKSKNLDFVRLVELEEEISTEDFKQKLQKISPKLRYVNNYDKKTIKSAAFCAGSGSEFIDTTEADAFVTGDLKFHTALDSKQIVFDIGHFESEIFAPKLLSKIVGEEVEKVIADEKSPFI